jgi:iron-sulfur cluster repair protein YtfE (RIC family)
MDAISFLLAEHRRFRRLITTLEDRTVDQPEVAFVSFANDLVIHAAIEEEILYPRLATIPALRDKIRHAYHEHHLLDVQIDELAAITPHELAWTDKLHVLKETLEHHLDEEEADVFPEVSRALANSELAILGESLADLREEYELKYGQRAPASAQGAAAERLTGG